MWFKQNDPKSPQQAEPVPARPQPPPPAVQTSAPVAAPEPARVSPAPPAPQPVSAQASCITPGLSLKGEISGSEELWIGGSVDGKLHFSGARITVGGSGTVRGEMDAREIVIEGRIEGNLRGAERVAISRSGQVKGDASAPRVAIEEGAVFNGSIHVLREGESRAASRSAGAGHSASPPRPPRPASSPAASAAAASGGAASPSVGIAASGLAAASDATGTDPAGDTIVAPRGLRASPAAPESE